MESYYIFSQINAKSKTADVLNFGDIVWPDRLNNKSGSPLSPSEGESLIEIMNDYGLEQLVHFPTRERNTLDKFVDIHSPDRLSDHDFFFWNLESGYSPH